MLVLEAKLHGKAEQFQALDEAIRTARFVQNSCLRYWMDNRGTTKYDLYKFTTALSHNALFPWVAKLNSMARQASTERAWSAISRFFENCKQQLPGKKGYPQFKRHHTRASVEYKTTGWKLSPCRRLLTFSDKFGAGTFKLWGTRDLHFYQLEQINRVRVVRRSDGYYVQFVLDVERTEEREPTHKTIGLDVGLSHFLTDSEGNTVENPRHLRKAEKRLKRIGRRVSRKQKGSANRQKAVNRLGRAHLKVQRQRQDFACKLARCVVKSHDLVAYEDLKIRNLVKNRHLAKSIGDAAWGEFRRWVEYFGRVFGTVTVAVAPHHTSQECSACGSRVKKSLSERTHLCECGCVLDRDHNAALNILQRALATVGHTESAAPDAENVCGATGRCVELAKQVQHSGQSLHRRFLHRVQKTSVERLAAVLNLRSRLSISHLVEAEIFWGDPKESPCVHAGEDVKPALRDRLLKSPCMEDFEAGGGLFTG